MMSRERHTCKSRGAGEAVGRGKQGVGPRVKDEKDLDVGGIVA